jgi:hypothetical protein
MGLFERYLTLWVALCIVAGVALGHIMPGFFAAVATAEVAKVNLPVAALIWLMIVPMLLKIDFGSLGQVREHWRGVGVTLFINWAVKPFSMALLGSFFIGHVFAPMLPAAQIPSYIAGLILLAAAPCTAMVFVWSNLCEGEPHYTLSQVALNDVIMVFLFAPLVGLLLGVASISVPWGTLLLSVLLYIVVPVIVAQAWRRVVLQRAAMLSPAACECCSLFRSLRFWPHWFCCSAFRESRSSGNPELSRSSQYRSWCKSISMRAWRIGSAGGLASPGASPLQPPSSARATSSSWRSPLPSACSASTPAQRLRLSSAFLSRSR